MHNRIAIFGLTGDPFTIAHRDICKRAIDTLQIDKLYVIPTVVDYHRKGKERWLTDLQRVYCMEKMLWTLGNEYREKYEIDTHELMLKSMCENDIGLYNEIIKPRRFIHTLLDFKCRLAKEYDVLEPPEIVLIIGSDELHMFQSWHRWDAVSNNINYLVVVNGRDNTELEIPVPIEIKFRGRLMTMELSESYLYNVSATAVRHWYKNDGLKEYLDDVKKLDDGELDWLTIPWINKAHKEQEHAK